MLRDDALVAQVLQDCRAPGHDEASLCRLMRHSVRKLLDHSGAVVQMQAHQAQRHIMGFDVAPCLARALRIAAHTIEGGVFLSWVYEKKPIVINVDRLRSLSLGPHLRPLASGHLALHRHADSGLGARSVFVFTGVRKYDPAQLASILNAITPSLHRVFHAVYQARSSTLSSLTPAERAICRLLLKGVGNKEIARMLRKSEVTVRNQLQAVFTKLRVNTRTAAAVKLREVAPAILASDGNRKVPAIENLFF